MRLEVIDAGFFKLDGGAMFGVVPKSIWEKINPPDAKNLCTWALRLLYMEVSGRKILIDTGMGNKQTEKFFNHYEPSGNTLENSLDRLNILPEEITDVFLTHLHFDHCGGAVLLDHGNSLLKFPNACYWTSLGQWDWATNPNGREKASFLPENIFPIQQSGRLKLVSDEGVWISELPNIHIRFFNGHTNQMMIPFIQIGEKTLVYCADLLPSTGHIPLPYIMAYDTRPLITLREKEKFLIEAAEKNYILFLEHDPHIECCTVEKTEKGIRCKDTFPLSSISWHLN
jgi:glyoxylase-like metal-dependent hydrolase (beta-lactamase superfamily II)